MITSIQIIGKQTSQNVTIVKGMIIRSEPLGKKGPAPDNNPLHFKGQLLSYGSEQARIDASWLAG